MQIARFVRWPVHFLLMLFLGLLGNAVWAGGLQISPVSLEIPAASRSGEVWLRNAGTDVVHAQVRVYRWSQDKGEDVLTPDNGMAASPPMVQVAAGQQQLVRLVRIGSMAASAANERTYRLVIDELPIKKPNSKIGLDFVFRYSIPVFVAGTAPAKFQLDWSVHEVGKKVWLQVNNGGNSHAQLANLAFTPSNGKSVMVYQGLAGYALPGKYRRVELSAPASLFASGGTFNSLINGIKTATKVRPISKAP
ncbi:fimbrial biogenesis chaperone [Paralcaligenes ureilyticus]|uniref:Fimbrial chaperone protein n=1 Tax=Paralcaligenes ureilyticus TaxID=627131 RepID=A0A4R3LV18_9BURK|nr:fimbria/pilus periplasmic chaperone [Paralcaligenes ureilyticus]TCT04460.1 fimbrial chaperone protein [Paralcaligenes ureilyticus]